MTVRRIMVKKTTKVSRQTHAVSPVPADEVALFKRLKRGDSAARDILIHRYSSWVTNIAKKYHFCFPQIDLSELIAEGNRGLLEALGRYDPSKPVKFSTYAWFWIVKNVQDYIKSDIALVEVPRKVMADLKKITNSINEETKKGNSPTLESVARKIDMDVGAVRELLSDKKNISGMMSLDKYLDEEDPTQTIGDLLVDKNEGTMHDILDRSDDKTNLVEMMRGLSDVEQEVLKLRFGFSDNRFHALKEVGKKLNLSPSKVRDIEYVALAKLKRSVESKDE